MAKWENKKVIGLMKNELDKNVLKEFVALRAKTYSYLTDNNDEDKKTKGIKKCVAKATKLKNKINHLEKIILI